MPIFYLGGSIQKSKSGTIEEIKTNLAKFKKTQEIQKMETIRLKQSSFPPIFKFEKIFKILAYSCYLSISDIILLSSVNKFLEFNLLSDPNIISLEVKSMYKDIFNRVERKMTPG